MAADERARFLDHLMAVAERGIHENEALLRRQAVYLLGFDARPQVADWLRHEWHRVGERADDQVDDGFMLDDDARSWTGVRLMQHLVWRLEPESPHLPLNLHTLHALVASRPTLLDGPPGVRASLDAMLDRVAGVDSLSRTGRDQVAGLRYALRIAHR